MKKLLILIILLNGVVVADVSWVRIVGWSDSPLPPEKVILKSDTSLVFISNTIFGFIQQDTTVDNKDFKRITISEEPIDRDTTRAGKPQVPYLRLLIAVPDSCSFDITIDKSDYTLFEDYLLYPVPRIVFETDTTGCFYSREVYAYDTSFYQIDTIYPGIFYEVNEQAFWRGQRILEVFIYPVQYNPGQELMYFYNRLNLTIEYSGEAVENGDGLGPFEELGRQILLNYPGIDRQPGPHPPPAVHYYTDLQNTENIADYIIVTHEDILGDMQGAYWIDALAQWRVEHDQFDIGVVKMRDIYEQFGPQGNDSTQLRNFLIYAYENWQAPSISDGHFAYCLFIGDWDYVPTRLYLDETWYAADEHYYRDLSTTPDSWEDIMLGRWPVKAIEIQDLGTIASKTITYESEPDIGPNIHNWRRRGLVIEGEPDFMISFQRYFLDIDYDTVAVRRLGLTPSQYKDSVTFYINEGDIAAVYCGHGNANGWMWYYSDNLADLNNEDSLPAVMSLACYTGSFQSDYNTPGWKCFGENFIFEDGGGCIAFYGATKKTLLDYCERDGKQILNRMLGYQAWILGKCLVNLGGKKDFCLLGDPALDLGDYTALPDYPDLVIRPQGTDISLDSPYPYPSTNSIIPIHAKVWNIGHAVASDIRVKFTVRSEETVIYTNTIVIPVIDPADTVIAVTYWNTAFTHPDQIGELGDLVFTVEVDPNNAIVESWEYNNASSITRPVVLYPPGWSRKVSRVSQPALADLDQAGSVEIVYPAYDSVYAFAPDGSVVLGWPRFFKGVYGVVLGDIDNNGRIEVVAVSPESIKVYDHQGTVLSGWPVSVHLEDYRFTGLPSLGRIESDVADVLDIAVCARTTLDDETRPLKILVYNHLGFRIYEFNTAVQVSRKVLTNGPSLENVHSQGNDEIVISYSDRENQLFKTEVFNNNGLVTTLDYGSGYMISGLMDLSQPPDGFADVITGGADGKLRTYDVENNQLLWEQQTEGPINSSPAVGDIHPGIPYPGVEITFGNDGSAINLREKSIGDLIPPWSYIISPSTRVNTSPAIANINGVANLDIIIGANDQYIYAFKHTRDSIPPFPLPLFGQPSSPVIGDIDGDEKSEIILSSDDGYLHVWKNLNSRVPRYFLEWPQFHHDYKRTGVYLWSE